MLIEVYKKLMCLQLNTFNKVLLLLAHFFELRNQSIHSGMPKPKCKFRDELFQRKTIKQARNCFEANCSVCNCTCGFEHGGEI